MLAINRAFGVSAATVPVMVKVTTLPAANDDTVQRTWPVPVQVGEAPTVDEVTSVTLAGKVSLIVTLVAVAAPAAFVTTTVYEIGLPAITGLGEAVLLIERLGRMTGV